MVFKNISVLLVAETGVPKENHRPCRDRMVVGLTTTCTHNTISVYHH
jgi:hypothetical protein